MIKNKLFDNIIIKNLFLKFLENYERQFITQGPYDVRSIFKSLDLSWDLLRAFPPEKLKNINRDKINNYYYDDKDNVKDHHPDNS